MNVNNKILSDITVYMKYAKFIPELNRRETWEELVDRNKEMHLKKFPNLKDEIEEAAVSAYSSFGLEVEEVNKLDVVRGQCRCQVFRLRK